MNKIDIGMPVPLLTAEAAMYPYSDELRKKFTTVSRFGDPILMYRIIGSDDKKFILLPREACPLGEKDKRLPGSKVKFTSKFVPRSTDQSGWVAQIVARLQNDESHIAQAPTGFGKTACTMDVVATIGVKTLVVVTKEDVRDQWYVAAKKFLGLTDAEIGLVQGDVCNTVGKKFIIAMIQSVAKEGRYNKGTFSDVGLVIWDEVHRVGADMFSNSAWLFPAKLRLGLSATPYRKDGKDVVFYSHIGPVLVKTTVAKLVPKVLVKWSSFKLPIVNRGGKWIPLPHEPGKTMHISKLLAKDPVRNQIIADFIVQAWKKGRNTIMFSDLLDHGERVFILLRKAGVPSKDIAFYVGGLSTAEREAAKVKPILLSTYSYTSEATDIPWLDTMVMATPRSDIVQIVGRVLREYEDKKNPVVLDIVDNTSSVFRAYYGKRLTQYKAMGAEMKILDN